MQEKKPVKFKEILERNTSLLTILGIFNALSIYSGSLEGVGKYVSFCFLILSMMVLWQVIIDFHKNFYTVAITVFGMVLLFCQLGFVIYSILSYYDELQYFLSYVLSFIVLLFLMGIIIYVLFRNVESQNSLKFYLKIGLLLVVVIFCFWLEKKIFLLLEFLQPYIELIKL